MAHLPFAKTASWRSFLLICISGNHELSNGQILGHGQELKSINRKYRLVMQTDGNLVLYRNDGVVKWHTHTHGKGCPPYILAMQSDNNLVIYAYGSKHTWHTHTHGRGAAGAKAILQDDGNFVIYDGQQNVLWHSGTHGEYSFPISLCLGWWLMGII